MNDKTQAQKKDAITKLVKLHNQAHNKSLHLRKIIRKKCDPATPSRAPSGRENGATGQGYSRRRSESPIGGSLPARIKGKHLAGYGTGGGSTIRTHIVGGRSPPAKSAVNHRVIRDAHGDVVAKAVVHPDLSSFTRATRTLVSGAEYHGSGLHEVEHYHKGRRTVRVSGRELIKNVGMPAQDGSHSYLAGATLLVRAIHPESFGGRLALLSEQYEEHEFHHLRFIYVPQVAATQPGAIALACRNDSDARLDRTGIKALQMAATSSSYIQTPVWEMASITVRPEDITKRYFDVISGEARLSTQGLFQVLLAFDHREETGSVTYGSVYVEYDVSFYAEHVEWGILPAPILSLINVDSTWGCTEKDPVIFTYGYTNAQDPQVTLGTDSTSGKVSFICDHVWALVITYSGGAFRSDPAPLYGVFGDESWDEELFSEGKVLYARAYPKLDDWTKCQFVFFATLDAALEFQWFKDNASSTDHDVAVNTSMLLWLSNFTAAARTGGLRLTGSGLPLGST